MQNQAKKNLLQRLDANDYSDDEVVVLTIPITLPYPIHQNGYERVDGEFEYQGDHYKLVKQKLENDTLFLVCIKDMTARKLAVAMSDYSKMANNVPLGSKQTLNFLGKIFKDYNTSEFIQWYKGKLLHEKIFYAVQIEPVLKQSYPVDCPPPELFF